MSDPTVPESVTSAVGVLSRRRFLLSLLAGWAGASFLPWQLAAAETVDAADAWPAWLSEITGEPTAVVRLGQAYLATHPNDQDPDHLIRLIDERLVRLPGLDPARLVQPAQIARALKQCVRYDYVNDATVSLDGWVLSETEARLYALVAALQQP